MSNNIIFGHYDLDGKDLVGIKINRKIIFCSLTAHCSYGVSIFDNEKFLASLDKRLCKLNADEVVNNLMVKFTKQCLKLSLMELKIQPEQFSDEYTLISELTKNKINELLIQYSLQIIDFKIYNIKTDINH